MSRKVPVPWVHLTMPGRMQPWANSAECWSAIEDAIGTRAPIASTAVWPSTPESSRTSG